MKTSIITALTLPAVFLLWGTIGLKAQNRSDNSTGVTKGTGSSSQTQQSGSGSNAKASESRGGNRNASRNSTDRGNFNSSNSRNNDRVSRGGDRGQGNIVVKENRSGGRNSSPRGGRVEVIETNRSRRAPEMHEHVEHVHDNHARIRFGGEDYSYENGHYYRIHNGSYLLTLPPHGIRVSIIPAGFISLLVGNLSYYYFGGVYYREVAPNSYEVVDPPIGAIVPELPSDYVKTVNIKGRTYFECDNMLYKPISTPSGIQYKVIGTLNDDY